jgi:acetoin:2,6-dichlorophenolindophenol oxidoreductase subunit alpha
MGRRSARRTKLRFSDEEMLRRMLRIRLFDEAAVALYDASELAGALHTTIGQEAAVVGACAALNDGDYMTGNHRSHGHPIGMGSSVGPLMAELFGRESGICRGKGGSMHLADFSVGSLGESGIVGAGLPIAVGAGLSAAMRGSDQVVLAFFGDGAANSGPFHESVNLAAVWKLPVIFFCENNGYAFTTPAPETTPVEHVAIRATSYGIPGVIVEGQDPLTVYDAVATAATRARAGEGPSLLDVKTYRYREHCELGPVQVTMVPYRTEEEVDSWVKRDPIALFSTALVERQVLTEDEVAALEAEGKREIDDAVAFARASPPPLPETAYEDLYANQIPTFN